VSGGKSQRDDLEWSIMAKKTRPVSAHVTQADIAALVGCSQNTVALALKDSARLSEGTRAQIQKVAREMGYRPAIAAQGLRQGRSGLIGLYGGVDPIRMAYVKGLMEKLHGTKYKPILGIDFDVVRPWHTGVWIDTLLSMQVEALVCFAWNDMPVLPTWADRVPVVMCGFSEAPLGKGVRCDSIVMDRAKGVGQALDFLHKKGHKRIDMLQTHYGWYVTDAFVGWTAGKKLPGRIVEFREGEASKTLIERFVADFKKKKERPTALFVLPTPIAVELYYALEKAGVRVPEDLELVSYDMAPWLKHLDLPLHTVEQPIGELVEATVEVVFSRLNDLQQRGMRREVEMKLVLRSGPVG
jgi:LacI family transcriptional regulator